MRLSALLALLAVLVAQPSQAQTPAQPLPSLITNALAVFQAQGTEAGVRALTPNWTGTDDEAKQQQLIDGFKQIQEYAGPLVGYDLVRRFDVSPHLTRAYIVLLFKHLPTFLVVSIYSAPGQELWSPLSIITPLLPRYSLLFSWSQPALASGRDGLTSACSGRGRAGRGSRHAVGSNRGRRGGCRAAPSPLMRRSLGGSHSERHDPYRAPYQLLLALVASQ